MYNNFLRKKTKSYLTPSAVDFEDTSTGQITEGEWRQQVLELVGLQPIRKNREKNNIPAERIRDFYKEYYNNKGKVPFQEQMINHC